MAEKMFMSPLADPVVSAVFNNVEQAGLAAQSLVGSILEAEGIKIGKVIDLKPQKTAIPNVGRRSTRVDVFAQTDTGERILVEVQMHREPLLERNILAVSQDLASTFKKGSDAWDMRNEFPTIYVINIMNYPIRDTNSDFIQPVMLMYTKPPQEAAFEKLKIFDVILPEFRKKEHDLTKKLDAWLYILDTAEQSGKTVEEVIAMNETLYQTVLKDMGLTQFTKNYDYVTADDELRNEYNNYVQDVWYVNGIIRCAKEEGKLETAHNLLKLGVDTEIIVKSTGLPLKTIESLTP